jgi:predicted CXXCH cytochrome family protein
MVAFTAATSFAAITNSAHDLSGIFGTPAEDQICIFCHSPHNAIEPAAGPLWNHTLSTVTTYTMYTGTAPGSDLQGTLAGQPSGISKLCLSCHDGTVAIDAYGKDGVAQVGTSNMGQAFGPRADLGTDLSNDHPISITYTTTTAQADGELNDPATYIFGGEPIINNLDNDQLQCSTCHDVHNGPNVELNPKLLRADTAGSAVCLACHAK